MKYQVTDDEFVRFRDLIFRLCGIHLSPNKKDLLQSRLHRRLLDLNFQTFSQYYGYLSTQAPSHPEWQTLINLITTNKTDFFREPAHFAYLTEKFLPEWEKLNPGKKLRVWSAACSTGEEPYTLAIILNHYFKGEDRFEILASDIDTQVLNHAKNGVYRLSVIEAIPGQYIDRSVVRGKGNVSEWFKIRDELKRKIKFVQRNLIEFPYKGIGDFDVIFCRNVFIYFTPEVITEIVNNFYNVARNGAFLAIGHSETLFSSRTPWLHSGSSIFRKRATRESPAPVSAPVRRTGKNASQKRRVLVVDDSKTIRDLLVRLLNQSPELEVVGEAANPIEAEPLISKLKPDVMTLDIQMPHMDGVTFLQKLMPKNPLPVVMVSALSLEDGNQVFQALDLGAVDYVQKPSLGDLAEFGPLIQQKVRAAADVRPSNLRVFQMPVKQNARPGSELNAQSLIAIGSSTGGTEALREVLTALPENIPPIVIVQHIPPVFSKAFADRLNDVCPFEVKEAADGDTLTQNRVLIAPGGKQMRLELKGADLCIKITDDAPVNRHKPSVDYLFDSVAKIVGRKAVGVILTGMGSDGAAGLRKMRQAGAHTIAQNEESCVVFGMPKQAIALGAVVEVCALDKIPGALVQILSKKKAA